MRSVVKKLPLSKVTLGTVALGLPYAVFDTPAPTGSDVDLIRVAYQAGINCFDTARAYGTAEELLGATFQASATEQPTIISKFKWSQQACFNLDLALEESRKSVQESLAKLKLSALPICLFHMVSSFDGKAVQRILPLVFSRLKAEGLIEQAGVSLDHPSELNYFVQDDFYDAFQIPLNIFDQRLLMSPAWQKMIASNKLIFIRSIFLKGLLLQNPHTLPGNLQVAMPYLQQLAIWARELDMSVPELCLSYVRDLPGVSSLIIGPITVSQLLESIQMNAKAKRIPETIRQQAQALFKDIPEHILTPKLWKI